jgi:hypothetical protein
MAKSDTKMADMARRETEDETKEECLVVTMVPMTEDKLFWCR